MINMKRIFILVVLLAAITLCVSPVSAIYFGCTNGTDATIGVNWTFTGANGTLALVTNVGTPTNALLDFVIPAGADGAPGAPGTPGTNGTNGTPATVAVNYTGTTSYGTPASVVNIGTTSDALLNFIIPAGAPGTNGTVGFNGTNGTNGINGTSATISINYTSTLPAGNAATVTNIGNTSVASFDFGIPRGYNGTDTPPGSDGWVLYNSGGAEGANASFYFTNTTGTVTATAFVGDGSGLTGIGSTAATALTFDAKACGVAIKRGQAIYISGASGNNPVVCQADNTNSAKSRVVGISVADYSANAATAKVRRAGTLTAVDTRATNGDINPLGQTWSAGDLLFATTGGGLTNVRPTTGRSVKVAYSLTGSGVNDILLAYPMENPVWITAASGEDIVLRVGGSAGSSKVSVRNYTNTELASIDSSGYATFVGMRAGGLVHNVTDPVDPQDAATRAYVLSTSSPANYTGLMFTNGTRAMTGNISMGGYSITGIVTGVGADAVNRSYVDSGLPYVGSSNASLVLTSNGSYILAGNTSYVLTGGQRAFTANQSMGGYYLTNVITGSAGDAINRSYVDAGLPYVSSTNQSIILAGNTSFVASSNTSLVLTSNTSYVKTNNNTYVLTGGNNAFTANQSMGGKSLTNVVTGSAADAVNRSYVDSGLPYVLATNTTLVLTNNGSYVQTGNTTYVLTGGQRSFTANQSMGGYSLTNVLTGSAGDAVNRTYVDSGLPYVLATNASLVLTGNTTYVLTGGQRAHTANQSMGGFSLTNVVTGSAADAVNRSYVDSGLPYITSSNTSIVTTGNTTYVLTGGQRAFTANQSMGGYYLTNVITGSAGDAINRSYVDSGLPYISSTNQSIILAGNTSYVSTANATYVLTGGQRAFTANESMGGYSLTNVVTGSAGDAVNRSYVDAGLPYVGQNNASLVLTSNGSYVLTSNGSYVLTSNGSYILGTNTSYVLVDGSRAFTMNQSMGGKSLTNVVTGSAGDAVNRSYVDSLSSTANYTGLMFTNGTRNMTGNLTMGSNYIGELITGSTGDTATNKTYVDTKAPATIYGYVTMMAGSSMIPTTNPTVMGQFETSTQKNNYIYTTFSDGGSEKSQWIVDMPGDWNSTDATNGKLTFNFLWTAAGGSGTVKFDIAGKLLPDDGAIDTATANIGTATDTLITAEDMHVSPDTTAAVVTSVGTGGRTAILSVTRDSSGDTLNANAKLIGVRIKYIKTVAG